MCCTHFPTRLSQSSSQLARQRFTRSVQQPPPRCFCPILLPASSPFLFFLIFRCGGLCAAHGIHPKYLENRSSKKHAIFHRFLLECYCLLQGPTSKKRAPTQCFVDFSHNSAHRFGHAFLLQKTYQKPSQNEVRTLQKIDVKKCVVFQHRFFRVWASILEGLGPPTWSQVRRAACSARRVKPHCIFCLH